MYLYIPIYMYLYICTIIYNIYTHIYTYIYTYACVLGHFSHVQLLVTLWITARQTPLSMEFSRQDYWSVFLACMPCPPPADHPHPGTESTSSAAPDCRQIFYY